MDFARFAQDYLNQQTEGDPSFMVSDEALFFVDLMRKDDMDRRASQVRQETNPDERGEPTHEEVISEAQQAPQTTAGDDVFASEGISEPESVATLPAPAAPVSEVALGADALQASFFSEDSLPVEQSQPVAESPVESEPSTPAQERGDDAAAVDLFSETQQQDIAPNELLQAEGVQIHEVPGLTSETTILQPMTMPDFAAMLAKFDRDYRPPDPKVGDDIEIPRPPELKDHEKIRSSTEFAEAMIAEMSDDFLNSMRRKA